MTRAKSTEPPIERLALKVPEAAAMVGVSRAHVYRAIESGQLAAVRLAGPNRPLIRITPQALADWLAAAPNVK